MSPYHHMPSAGNNIKWRELGWHNSVTSLFSIYNLCLPHALHMEYVHQSILPSRLPFLHAPNTHAQSYTKDKLDGTEVHPGHKRLL